MSQALAIDETTAPKLARGVRLRFDEARGQWLILAPERVLIPDEIAVAALRRCIEEGETVGQVIDGFAKAYDAPRDTIAGDVVAMLQDLADKGLLRL